MLGWECPICHRGLSPSVAVCPCVDEKKPSLYEPRTAPGIKVRTTPDKLVND